jgi:hypothetical protein
VNLASVEWSEVHPAKTVRRSLAGDTSLPAGADRLAGFTAAEA